MDWHLAQAQLNQALASAAARTGEGEVARYIPELARQDPHQLGVSVMLLDGTEITAGDVDTPFTLQSISKVFTLMLAICDNGADAVFERVGKEPTGDPFNSIIKLEMTRPHKPLNPMINAGAIAVCDLIAGRSVEERLERIVDLIQKMSGNRSIRVNEQVYRSEKETAHRNRALAHFLKDTGVLTGDVEETLDLYFRHCAIEATARDVAHMGAVFAAEGRDLRSGDAIVPLDVARICKTFMVTCGMYNASGEFAINVGIPAKSGVAGGILASVPHRMGIGVYGPALDDKGNSIGGVALLEELSRKWNLSIF